MKNKIYQIVMAVFLSLFALENIAQNVPVAVKSAVDIVSPNGVDTIEPAPLSGFYAVRDKGQVYYVTQDGGHILFGELINVRTKVNYSARMRRANVVETLDKHRDRMISFAPKDEKYRVVVVTDVNCGYCRKFHAHMPTLHRMGIRVDYLMVAFQGGDAGYDSSVSVWCAADRKKALTVAKSGGRVKPLKCKNPIDDNRALVSGLGTRGTPHIFLPNGADINGYVAPDELLARLREITMSQDG